MSTRGLAAAFAAFAIASILGLGANGALASSHREAPAIGNDPANDNTDLYMFVSPESDDAVTLVGCWWPLEEASGGPNWFHFSDNTAYRFHISNDGDADAEITYVFRFKTQIYNGNTFLYATNTIDDLTDADWNYRQTYSVTRIEAGQGPDVVIASDLVVPPVNIGPRTTPNYESLVDDAYYTLANGTKVFAGQRDDPFFVDLGAVFDLLAFRVVPGNMGEGVDGVGGYNCQAIVIEVPIEDLTSDGSNPSDPGSPAAVIGAWATSARANFVAAPAMAAESGRALTGAGRFTQVSRLGMPLVNEVVIPLGKKDLFNGSQPKDDAQFLSFVQDPELAGIIEALYGVTKPPAPRCDLVAAFLTGVPGLNQPPNVQPSEMMRLNVAIKPDAINNRFGVLAGDLDGFPNGRRLFDDVVDIEERVVAGVLYPAFCDPNFTPHPLAGSLGDGVDQNDMPFLSTFPYLATPHQGWDHEHHRVEPPHPPEKTERRGARLPALEATESNAESAAKTARFELGLSRPNPTAGGSQIAFQLAKDARVNLTVYDVSGRAVKTLADETLPAGAHSRQWDGTDNGGRAVSSGVYVYRLETPGERAERKLTVMK